MEKVQEKQIMRVTYNRHNPIGLKEFVFILSWP